MNNVGVIAEFNPFHNGHDYLFNAIRNEINPDGIVCVMSGDFVQRGYPAVTDKWSRAKAAVACGADLVIELPVVYSLSSAGDFACGGVRILEALGTVGSLAFGSESADIDKLRKISEINIENCEELKKYMNDGMSYAAALSRVTGFDAEPNDILGIEYLRNISSLTPYAFKRSGRGHVATASYIRDNMAELELFVPEDAMYELSASVFWEYEADRRLFEMVRYALMMKPAYELADIMGIGEGLENALKKACLTASSVDEIIKSVKSKRYTYSRISRALMCIVLDMNKDLIASAKLQRPYARVLAMNKTGAGILKESKKAGNIDIISNLSKSFVLLSPYKDVLEADIQAADLYSILTGRNVREFSDFVLSVCLEQ